MKKRKKKAGQVTRLIDLEVDEVSLVDKPAIGEEIYLTKSVEGGKVKLKKKNILKTGEEEEAAAADPKAAAEGEEETKEIDTNEEADGEEEAEAAEGEEGEEEEAAEGEEEEEAEEAAAPAEGDLAKRVVALEKNTQELQEMLATSLDFHDQAAQALNSVVVITMAALEMLVDMSEEDMVEEPAATEAGAAADVSAAAKSVGEIRTLCKQFQEDVKKAGAKISSSRMALLQDIATKLNALISSVSADEGKGGKKGKKKSVVVMESLKQQIVDLKKSFTDVESEKEQLKKQVAEQATRLGEIENTAGASAGIGDDEEEDSESESEGDKTKNKSVFAGLIPVEQIKERHQKRQDFLNRKVTKES